MEPLSTDEFIKLKEYTLKKYGIDLSQKRSMAESRINNILTSRGYQSFTQYFQRLTNDQTGTEAAILANKLSTNYTFFMREPNHFYYFRDTILPYLASTIKNKDLRVWSAGCSSGEEAYTLAMILSDYFGTTGFDWDTKVLATDISLEILEIALNATYSEEQIKELPGIWKMRYFETNPNGGKRLIKSIRDGVIFRKFNLIENNYPFKQKFHVIFCRNVMIYFDNEVRKKLIDRLYNYTASGGYLIIGHSESINRKETDYRYVMPAVYRKE
jgi:chemotaxis protein methyltransferase CheR